MDLCAFFKTFLYTIIRGQMRVYGIDLKILDNLLLLKGVIEVNNYEKPNFTKLANELGVSRDTIRKYYNGNFPKKTRNRESIVAKDHEIIKDLLGNEHKSFDYKSHLYRYLQNTRGVTYAESTFRAYVNKHFKQNIKSKKTNLKYVLKLRLAYRGNLTIKKTRLTY